MTGWLNLELAVPVVKAWTFGPLVSIGLILLMAVMLISWLRQSGRFDE